MLLAHKLAMASPRITADCVEATEFPHLANKYDVYGVPRTVINEVIHIEGALGEAATVGELMQVMDAAVMGQLKAMWEADQAGR